MQGCKSPELSSNARSPHHNVYITCGTAAHLVHINAASHENQDSVVSMSTCGSLPILIIFKGIYLLKYVGTLKAQVK